jgi:cobalt-zinc-cadmium efflux system outer membrane protein
MTNRPWTFRVAACASASVLIFGLATPYVAAQSVSAPVFTLKQAFEAAWKRQPQARSASARAEAAQAQQRASSALTAGPWAAEIAAKRTNSGGAREYEAALAVPLWLPGERGRAATLAGAQRSAVESRLAADQLRVAAGVREAWWTAQRAAQDVLVAQARLTNAERLAADVARRVKAGDLARADQHQAEGALASARADLAQAQAAGARARQALQTLVATDDRISATADPEPRPAVDAAPTRHPLLQELTDRVETARRSRELTAVQRRGNPELVIGTTRERGALGEPYSQSLNVAVRIPLGSSSRHAAAVSTAMAEQTEAEAELELQRARITADIATARVRVVSAEQSLAAARERLRLAQESRGFFERSFRLGETDLPTRLRVELEAFEAQRQSARAAIELAEAISEWRQALGLLPE